MINNKIYCGDCLKTLKSFPAESIDCVITSPPYWALRDYGVSGQLGLEKTFQEYINKLCDIFDEVKRVLKKSGTCWVNIGDTYSATRWSNSAGTSFMAKNNKNDIYGNVIEKNSGLSDKCLCQIPSRFAIEMVNRGWILRNELIWNKPNCMPSSAKDRFTVDFEKIFFFVKNKKYYFETQKEKRAAKVIEPRMIREEKRKIYNGKYPKAGVVRSMSRNKRCVWRIPTRPFKESHFAVFPEELIITPIKSGCPIGGVVLDPFMGSGTTGLVAKKLNRKYVGIELNHEYIKIAENRINNILI